MAGEQGSPPDEWKHYAIVDEFDRGGVLNLVRLRSAEVEEYRAFIGWRPSPVLAASLSAAIPPPTVELTDYQLSAVIQQIGPAQEAARTTVEDAAIALEQAFRVAWNTDRVQALEFGEVYVQWLREGSVVRVELVSNTYLSRDAQLTPAEQFEILDTGMLYPNPAEPNWSWTSTTPDDTRDAAQAVVEALAVYGVTATEIAGRLSS